MSGRFEHFDARAGGSYRLVLTYAAGSNGTGKATADTAIVEARFLDLVPGVRVLSLVVVFLLMTAPRRGAHRSQQSPSGGLFFATDDVRAAYEELKDRGVEFQQEPTEQPYGIDRDPSGNQMRVAQLNPRGFRNSANPLWLGRFETRAFDSPKRIRRGPKRTGEKLTSTRSIRYSRARA
jgi:hypothetical protein